MGSMDKCPGYCGVHTSKNVVIATYIWSSTIHIVSLPNANTILHTNMTPKTMTPNLPYMFNACTHTRTHTHTHTQYNKLTPLPYH